MIKYNIYYTDQKIIMNILKNNIFTIVINDQNCIFFIAN